MTTLHNWTTPNGHQLTSSWREPAWPTRCGAASRPIKRRGRMAAPGQDCIAGERQRQRLADFARLQAPYQRIQTQPATARAADARAAEVNPKPPAMPAPATKPAP